MNYLGSAPTLTQHLVSSSIIIKGISDATAAQQHKLQPSHHLTQR
jgi:hypothetical protein